MLRRNQPHHKKSQEHVPIHNTLGFAQNGVSSPSHGSASPHGSEHPLPADLGAPSPNSRASRSHEASSPSAGTGARNHQIDRFDSLATATSDTAKKAVMHDGHDALEVAKKMMVHVEQFLRDDFSLGMIHGEGHAELPEELLGQKSEGFHRYDYTRARWFNLVVFLAIVANAVQMGVETDHPDHEVVWKVFENLFSIIFFVEMCSKLFFARCKYFQCGWNIMDFILVWLSVVDTWVLGLLAATGDGAGMRKVTLFRMLRILRVMRFIRLLKVFKELWLIIKGMISSIKTIFWAALLLIVILYVSGIFCCQIIGHSNLYYQAKLAPEDEVVWLAPGEPDYFPQWDVHEHFGTVPRAMFTLFETSLEPLNLRPVVEKQPYMLPIFLLYIFLTTFGVMNVIIGVIVENTMGAEEDAEDDLEELRRRDKLKKVDQMKEACLMFDEDGDGAISVDELKQGLAKEEVQELVKDLDLPYGCDQQEVCNLLHGSDDESMQITEVMRGLMRCIAQTDTQHLLEIKSSLHHTQRLFRTRVAESAAVSDAANMLEAFAEKHSSRTSRLEQHCSDIGQHLHDLIEMAVPPSERHALNAQARPIPSHLHVEPLPPVPRQDQQPRVEGGGSKINGQGPVSSSNSVKPTRPKVSLSPRAGPQMGIPPIPLPPVERSGSRPLSMNAEGLSTACSSDLVSGRSTTSANRMSIPPALDVLLTAADFDFGNDVVVEDSSDKLFAFLPGPRARSEAPSSASPDLRSSPGKQKSLV